MPIIHEEGEKETVIQAAKWMLVSAKTAPKTGGRDDVVAAVLYGKEKEAIAEEMERIADERKIGGFKRDGKNLRDSEAALLIGVRGNKNVGLNCGACGYPNCEAFEKAEKKQGQDYSGPTCFFKALDMGIALGSAAKTASLFNIDNRIMYRVGTAAKRLGLLPDATLIIGIPLSTKSKNIYFDRPPQIKDVLQVG